MIQLTIAEQIANLPILPKTTLNNIEYLLNTEKNKVYNFIYNRFRQNIKYNAKLVMLFRLSNSNNQIVIVKKEDYSQFLETLINHFISEEEYEKVIVCKKIIEKYCK